MPTTTVTKHHHACVFVDDETTRILVDPGRLGPPPALDGVGAVLITHAHFEHFDPDLVHDALHQGIDVWAPEDVIAELPHHDLLHEAVAGVVPGGRAFGGGRGGSDMRKCIRPSPARRTGLI